jgi:hypothetical protein
VLQWIRETMSVNSIGIQVVMPKTGTPQQPQPQQQSNNNDTDDAGQDRRAPPPPGQGQYVDKVA